MPRYIDADRLINGIRQAVCTTCAIDYNKEKCRCDTGDCICYIEDCPTADVQEVRHGRWLSKRGYINEKYFECSHCGYDIGDDIPIFIKKEFEYCPKCGAKMDGGEQK